LNCCQKPIGFIIFKGHPLSNSSIYAIDFDFANVLWGLVNDTEINLLVTSEEVSEMFVLPTLSVL